MASTKQLIQQLFERRRNCIEQQRTLHAEIEARADGQETGEDKAKWEAIDKEIRDLGERIDHLVSMEEVNRDHEEQRARFEPMLQADNPPSEERNEEAYLRNFMRAALPDAEVYAPKAITLGVTQRDLVTGTPAAGGNLVPTGFVRTLMEHLVEMAAVRTTNASVLQTSSGESLLLPKTTADSAAVIVGEAAAIPEDDPTFGQVSLGAFKYGNLLEVSRELIEDNAVNLTDFLARNSGRAIGQANGAHLVVGTGTGQPEGITDGATVGKAGAAGQLSSVLAEDLIDLYHSVISGYRSRGWWIMNDLTAAGIRKIREDGAAGNFLWQPGLTAGTPDTILGRPVVTDPNMPVPAASAFSVGFGDFSAYYTIRDVNSVRFERSDDFRFANDLVAFRVLFRTDARQVINGTDAAVKFFQNPAV